MRSRLIVLVLLLLPALLAGCNRRPTIPPPPIPSPSPAAAITPVVVTPSPEATAAPPSPTATATPVPGGRPLQVVGPQELAQLPIEQPAPRDPLAALLKTALHASLLQPNPETAALEPGLAERWEVADDLVTFSLRSGLTWSDGVPLTAADIADNLLAAREAGRGRTLFHIATAAAPDDRTLEVTLDSAPVLCAAVSEIATWPIVDEVSPDAAWPPARTSGEYAVTSMTDGAWRFAPRPGSNPALGVWDYRQISDTATMAAWRAGTFDLMVGDGWLHGADAPPGAAESQVVTLQGSDLAVLAFRLEHPLLNDRGLRQALALGTDPGALWTRVYGASAAPRLTALLPPGHWAAPAEAPEPDVAAANDRLAALGWVDRDGDGTRERNGIALSFAVTLALSRDPRWEALALALREQWAALGVQVTPRYVEPPTLEEWLHKGDWEIALLAYDVPLDPDQGALWARPDSPMARDVNVVGFDNADAARLAASAASLPGCDPQQRAPLYHEFWRLVQADAPMVFLFPLPQRLFLGPAVAAPPPGWPERVLSWQPRRP